MMRDVDMPGRDSTEKLSAEFKSEHKLQAMPVNADLRI